MKKSLALLLVFVFAGLAQAQPTVTMLEFLSLNEGFATLTRALEVTGLSETLQDDTVTLLAPTDAAFAALSASQRESLLSNRSALEAFLNNLIVPEALTAAELLERERVRTLGSSVDFSRGSDGSVLIEGTAPIVSTDVGVNGGIRISNGVIHVIDALPATLR